MFHTPLGLIAAEDSSSGGGAAIFQLFFFGLIFVAMYFLLIRPQRRRTREAQELNRALSVGDEVQTASGIVGFITGFDKEDQAGDVAWIDIAENVEIRVMRSAISR
ncbi:MAG: preprotein translocase subunit YajC, partial [Actinomycetota bacterium]